jgi:hypothetical protein
MRQDNITPEELGADDELFRTDPIEQSPEYLAIADELERLIEERFPSDEFFIGRCTQIWDYKKQLLKEKYGILWRTPHEMNPDICFD